MPRITGNHRRWHPRDTIKWKWLSAFLFSVAALAQHAAADGTEALVIQLAPEKLALPPQEDYLCLEQPNHRVMPATAHRRRRGGDDRAQNKEHASAVTCRSAWTLHSGPLQVPPSTLNLADRNPNPQRPTRTHRSCPRPAQRPGNEHVECPSACTAAWGRMGTHELLSMTHCVCRRSCQSVDGHPTAFDHPRNQTRRNHIRPDHAHMHTHQMTAARTIAQPPAADR